MKKYLRIIPLFVITVILIHPVSTKAITLKQYEDEVAKYTAELKDKQAKIAKNDKEVAEIKTKIKNIESQITTTQAEIERLEKEIEESNEKITKKKEEIKKLMKYFQVISNENTYLEYIFGADSITDMIYRVSVVEQLTDYNDQIMKELDKLVKENIEKKKQLGQKQEELKKLKSELKDQQERIEEDTAHIEGTIPSTKGQIEFYQSRVNYYRNKGCKSNDVIGVTCDVPKRVTSSSSSSASVSPGATIGSNGFRFPVDGARITQAYGNAGHKGVDIGKSCGAPIYAVAPGRVYYVGSGLDYYGAKIVMIVHNVNGRLVFSQYAHLQSYNVSVGQDVDINSVIGYMGNTGYSFGCHLHLEMSQDKGWAYNATYYNYIGHIINPFTYVPR